MNPKGNTPDTRAFIDLAGSRPALGATGLAFGLSMRSFAQTAVASMRFDIADSLRSASKTHPFDLSPIPTEVHGRRMVLVPEEDWLGLIATIEIMQVPGLEESILQAAEEPPELWTTELDW